MNTVQGSYEKRSIKVKDFLNDFHSGADDAELMEKYRLTAAGMERFYTLLEERGILNPEDFAARIVEEPQADEADRQAENDESGFICPACHASRKSMFDTCPECGVSVQETMRSQMDPDLSYAEEDLPSEYDAVPETPFEHFEAQYVSEESLEPDAEGEDAPANSFSLPEAAEENVSESLFEAEAGEDTASESAYLGSLDSARESYELGTPFSESERDDFLRYDDDAESESRFEDVECEKCEGLLEADVRNIFDKKRAHQALKLSGAMFVLSLLAAMALHFFEGYSFARLLVVYSIGLFLMGGAVFLTVGALMAFAREKVYRCSDCWRIYPRA